MKIHPFLPLFLLFALSACSSTKTNSLTVSAQQPAKPPNSQEILQASETAMQTVKAYHFSFTAANPGSNGLFALTHADGDMLAPDKLQATATGSTLLGAINVQVIALGTQQFMTNPVNGKWLPGQGLVNATHLASTTGGVYTLLHQLKNLGTPQASTLAGHPCWQITGSLDPHYLLNFVEGVTPVANPIDTTVLIGSDDSLLYQVQMQGTVIHGDSAQTTRTFTLSRFNEAVTITAPVVTNG